MIYVLCCFVSDFLQCAVKWKLFYIQYFSHDAETWWLLRAPFLLVGVNKTKQWDLSSILFIRCADRQAVCLYSNKVPSHIEQQPSHCGSSDVSEAPVPLSRFALLSFQGNMCNGILPQLRQGLAGPAVGTTGVWENGGFVPVSFSHRHSFSLTHEATSLPSFSPYCNSSSSSFSPNSRLSLIFPIQNLFINPFLNFSFHLFN